MISIKKFYGVVIIYNPDEDVIKNIKSYIGHLKKLFIYDNSLKNNESLFIELSANYDIEYIYNGINDGISKALNNVTKKLYGKNDTWLLTMDQDSYFKKTELNKMFDFLQGDSSLVALVSPFHKTMFHKKKNEEVVEERLTVMTSGNFINVSIHENIGGFDERYFIDCVDLEYCLRLNSLGYKVLRLNEIELEHALGDPFVRKALIKKGDVVISNHNWIRRYYITRNKLLISSQYFTRYPVLCSAYLYGLIFFDLKNIIFYEKNKKLKLKFFLKGIKDFTLRNFGALQSIIDAGDRK